MSSTNSAPAGGRLRSIMEVTATVCLILASLAILAVSAKVWQQSAAVPTRVTTEPGIPTEPQAFGKGHLLGSDTAKIAIIEYSDFQCPFCGRFSRETWPALKREYVVPGKVVAEFRHLPLQIHPLARTAAASADCAGKQGRFWEMHDLLFQQTRLENNSFDSLALALGLNGDAFGQCLQSNPDEQLGQNEETAQRLGITGTPTFIVGVLQPGRKLKVTQILNGAQPFERFKSILDSLLSTNKAA